MRTEKVEMRPVLKYPGSKWKMAEWIISLMPPHKSYLEPFFGSGAVFFKKEPSRIETINDMDGEIVNLFRCIREEPEELMRCVTMTPYSRAEYEQAWGKFRFRAGVPSVGVEAARMTLVRYWQSHGSTSVYKGGWKTTAQAENTPMTGGGCGMSKKNMRRISILVTAQTAKNLERLASMCGYREIGMVVDKLTREKMISLHTDALMPGERKGKQI